MRAPVIFLFRNYIAPNLAAPEEINRALPSGLVRADDRSIWAGFANEQLLQGASAPRLDDAPPEIDDLQKAASYRLKQGFGEHEIEAYLALTPGDPDELALALAVFGFAGVSFRLPNYAVTDKTWTSKHGVHPTTLHYGVAFARHAGNSFGVIAFGERRSMTEGFYRRYCTEALAYVPKGLIATDPPGFDSARLQSDLRAFVWGDDA